jgi:hypothetical protein
MTAKEAIQAKAIVECLVRFNGALTNVQVRALLVKSCTDWQAKIVRKATPNRKTIAAKATPSVTPEQQIPLPVALDIFDFGI